MLAEGAAVTRLLAVRLGEDVPRVKKILGGLRRDGLVAQRGARWSIA